MSAETTQPRQATASYIYGIVRPDSAQHLALDGVGDPPQQVRTVRYRDLAALVSDVPEDLGEGSRRDLLAHARTLENVARQVTVLPMRFAMTVGREQAVVDEVLAPDYERWDQLLAVLHDRVELSLKVYYDEEEMLRLVVAEDPHIQRMQGSQHLPDRMRLGEMVMHGLEARKAADARHILDRLQPFAVELRENPPVAEGMLLHVSLLIARSDVETFDAQIQTLGEEAGGRLRLRAVGPLPPYSFVAQG